MQSNSSVLLFCLNNQYNFDFLATLSGKIRFQISFENENFVGGSFSDALHHNWCSKTEIQSQVRIIFSRIPFQTFSELAKAENWNFLV